MRFIKNFIKKLFGKKDECCSVQNEIPAESKVEEKAEVEKMTERLKDVTSSKPLSRIDTDEVISVKEIKARKKVLKPKKDLETTENPKAKKTTKKK